MKSKYDYKSYIFAIRLVNKLKCLCGKHLLDYCCIFCGSKCKCGKVHHDKQCFRLKKHKEGSVLIAGKHYEEDQSKL